MRASIYSINGKIAKETELPGVFEESVRPELIARAVLHEQSKLRQPKGVFKLAGLQTTAEYRGRKEGYRSMKNRGIARLPREKLPKGRFGKVRIVPFAVKGRRAHPPNPNKILVEKLNHKEYQKALRSAIAATARKELVAARGHRVNGLGLPIIVEQKFEELGKTREVVDFLERIGLAPELERWKDRKRITGVRARRYGGKRERKTVLIVARPNTPVLRAARNIAGVDVHTLGTLDARALAPGGQPGRLTLWSEAVIEEMRRM